MKLMELVGMALRTVVANPLRTILTMLGVIIGVSSVVALVSIGTGTSAKVEDQFESLGTNLLVVNVMDVGRATQLNYEELMQFEQFPEIDMIAPTIVKANSNIKYERTQQKFQVTGTNDRYAVMNKAQIDKGRFLAPSDLEFRSNVVVLGSEVAKTFFGFQDPVGEEINIDGVVFTVVGTLKPKGKNINNTSIDTTVLMPLETARRQYKLGNIRTTYIEATSKADIDTAEATMKQYLAYKFKSEEGFEVLNQNQMLTTANAASKQLNYLLVSIACISLLVGGIGIMNIMLVTVSERTREIGIRKSIGAKRRTILFQFLVESAVISGLGGVCGLLLGIGISAGISYSFPSVTTKISLAVSLGAFLFSVLVGIIFGLYPANKASKLRPIDALRFD
ncbi:ABC transporter permease [Paenibacillus aurantius]|uniref:ABC transporter permease n=1 Tax=Paenibacillus aurantius TaxID=2918900 RepID=A0AA96RB65_9BACL|nr:ABC transporter permease [Paenibacillus aurantius]WNQ09190.1 ABC transporter permease [Paenibacillus aurantius]